MTARTSRARTVAALALALAGTLLLAGCTGDAQDEPTAGSTAGSTAGESADTAPGGEGSDPGTASAADQVMAEQTAGAPGGVGGEVTVILRAVEVAGERMTVRWALRWDDDEAAADEGVKYFDMGVYPSTLVTDGQNLKAYRPFCTEGAWQAEDDGTLSGQVELQGLQERCRRSMLVSPAYDLTFEFPNHGTIEGWSHLPAPAERPETVDVAPVEGLPLFTDATVTYTDGGEG